ncbi:hypothetical protein CR513_33679, partial [Mucuna pruriens]
MDRNMIDATSGGALMDKTPTAARHLISNMASNMQQFGTKRVASTSKVVSERLENQLAELTSLVRQLTVGQHQQVMQRVCGICASPRSCQVQIKQLSTTRTQITGTTILSTTTS